MSAGVAATVRRVRDALAAAGAELAPDAVDPSEPGSTLVVDPAAWYAAQPAPPSAARLARTVALSLAPYGSAVLQDDAEAGRGMAGIAHPDARSAQHLHRLGCRATHVPLGCRAGDVIEPGHRPLELLTFGPSSQRRLRAVASGAEWFDHLRCAHRFDEELPAGDPADHPLSAAHVLLDIAAGDEPVPDPVLLLEASEAGAAVATERLDEWPGGEIAEQLVRAPLPALFAQAQALALEPGRAAALAAAARALLAAAFPLEVMGSTLAGLLADSASPGATFAMPGHRPQLSRHAEPAAPPPTVLQILEQERRRPDAAVRDGVRQLLAGVRQLDRRVERIEQGGAPDGIEVLLAATLPPAVSVSVLIPAFNARRVVAGALDSVHAAAGENDAPMLEIVLVDDASPQDDGAAVVEWAAAHPDLPVTVLRHRCNRGLAQARNTAMEHATGDLFLPLDADNALRPRGLRRLLDGLDAEPDAAFAYGLLQEFDTGGPVGLRGLYPWDPARLRRGNYIDALSLIRSDVLLNAGGYATDMPEQGYEDWDLWCRFVEGGATGVWVPEIVASYRIRADSMSAALHLSHLGPLADMVVRHPDTLG